MSEENVELVRDVYDALNEVNFDEALALADPPPEFEFVPSGALIPDLSGVLRGPEGLRRLAEFVGEFDDPHLEVHEIADGGDRVFAEVTLRGRGKQSGVETSWDFWHVWTLLEARIIRGQGFTDRNTALEAAGLSTSR